MASNLRDEEQRGAGLGGLGQKQAPGQDGGEAEVGRQRDALGMRGQPAAHQRQGEQRDGKLQRVGEDLPLARTLEDRGDRVDQRQRDDDRNGGGKRRREGALAVRGCTRLPARPRPPASVCAPTAWPGRS